jgi:diguanylate cyclase (GGDEF)-like protein
VDEPRLTEAPRRAAAPSTHSRDRYPLVVAWLFAPVVILLVGLSYYSMELLSAGRAYVGGQAQWIRAQSEAVLHLSQYVRTRNDENYFAYQRAIDVILGDRQARTELEKHVPDLDKARNGFLRGRIHADDIDGMIHSFRAFRQLPLVSDAVDKWTKADVLVDELIAIGGKVRLAAPESTQEADAILKQISRLDAQLTPLGHEFSQLLGEAQRRTKTLLLTLLLCAAAVLLLLVTLLAQRMLKQSHAMQIAMRQRALSDELTGLPNRAMFIDALERALMTASRHQQQLSVLFLDLDRFKLINDTLGHPAGDRVLQEVAARLKQHVRAGDLVARLGGDEFVVLVQAHGDYAEIAGIAQKLLSILGTTYHIESTTVELTASIGISSYPNDGIGRDELIKNADIAMYQAKDQGRNNFQFYAAPLNKLTVQRLDFEARLRHALQRNELLLHYQPIVDLQTGYVASFEALLRWNDPVLGMLQPTDFIPLAEETGLITTIGQWALEQACMQTRKWHDEGLPQLRIAVNMSARQFHHRGIVEGLERALQVSNLDARFVDLEITESMMMRDQVQTDALLRSLKQTGAGIVIDDFGTGYSSLAQMKRFPADSIKIDRSFIDDCAGDLASMAIVQAITAMSRSLHLTVVAEGVATEDQLRTLLALGCNQAQGYYFSKPVRAEDVPALARRMWSINEFAPKNRLRAVGPPAA